MNQPVENLYAYPAIRTFTGAYLNVFDIDPCLIQIEDIAHSLSHQCRFAGHTKVFYSVAEHCLHVAFKCSKENRLAALLHDASEAYLLDIPKPIKERIPEYKTIEDNLMQAIAKRFGFEYPLAEEVKHFDRWALEFEWENMVLQNKLKPFSSSEVKDAFLSLYYYLLPPLK